MIDLEVHDSGDSEAFATNSGEIDVTHSFLTGTRAMESLYHYVFFSRRRTSVYVAPLSFSGQNVSDVLKISNRSHECDSYLEREK